MKETRIRLLGALALVAVLAACSDSSAPRAGGAVSFSIATQSAGAGPSRPFATPDTVTAGSDVLVFEKVELVFREIEFQREDETCTSELEEEGQNDNHSCEEFKAGPILVDLPLGAGVQHSFTVEADTGTFDELQFKVHTPEDDGDAKDQAFIAAHPDFAGISIRVTGTWNGVPFTFTTDVDAEQEIELSPPLVITDNTQIEVTLMVDLHGWFLNGATLIDPALALPNGQFEGLVKNNIEASFDAFEDGDHDGHDDGNHDGPDDGE